LVKLNELDQYDDAELVRRKTAGMFAGFITRQAPRTT
jgi:capsid protein